MLFDISTGQRIFIPDWVEEQMKQDFPDFYNGKPVRIKVKESKMTRVMKVPSNNHNAEARPFVEPPQGTRRKARGIFVDEQGDNTHIQYSTSVPTTNNGVPTFSYPSANVTIQHGMSILSSQKDLLFYIHYLCPVIDGNRCAYKSSDQWYEYDRPEVVASIKISDAKKARELENLIYFDVPYNVILKAIEGLAMNKLDSEEQNRVALHDAIKNGSETFRRNAFEIIGSHAKPEAKKEEKTSEDVHELINRLVEDKSIKNDSGKWYIRDRRGDGDKFLKNAFFESDSPEGVFALIDHLKVNKELLDKLRKL